MSYAQDHPKEYRAWTRMIQRCHNEFSERYAWYGARGIAVCQEWRDSFEAFLAYVGNAPTSAHTIGRIKNNDGYFPGNVEWQTWREQGQDRRDLVRLDHQGETMSMAAWAQKKGMDRRVLFKRLKAGWPVFEALETPVAPRKKAG